MQHYAKLITQRRQRTADASTRSSVRVVVVVMVAGKRHLGSMGNRLPPPHASRTTQLVDVMM
jgi:hypothetical protein